MIDILLRSLTNTATILIGAVLIQIVLNICIGILVKFLSFMFSSNTLNIMLNWLTFIGTIHHELSHAIFAVLFGAKVVKMELFKPVNGRLGSVGYITRGNAVARSLQNTMIAIAPTITGLVSSSIIIMNLQAVTVLWQQILLWYLLVSILLNMRMSKQDIHNAFEGLALSSVIIFFTVMLFEIGLNE